MQGSERPKSAPTHTSQIWGVTIHPSNLGGESSEITCFTVVFEVHFLKSSPPKFGGYGFSGVLLGICLSVPQRVLFECFLACFRPRQPKSTQKALRGALPARAPAHSCKWRPESQSYANPSAKPSRRTLKVPQNSAEKSETRLIRLTFWDTL